MNTCASCKYFGSNMEITVWDPGKGDTDVLPHHACARIIHANGPRNRDEKNPFQSAVKEPAVVTDGSGYSARLHVLPTFGCNLYEAKA